MRTRWRTERGGLAFKAQDLAAAYVWSHRPDEECRNVTELRRRTAAVVASISNGTFHALWASFITGLAAMPVGPDHDLALEAEIDYDDLEPPPLADMPCDETTARKCRFLAHKHEYRSAWRCHQPSPSANPQLDVSKRALINLNPQDAPRVLTDADVADEPGVEPIQFSYKVVDAAARKLRDIKAPGTLPEDNRIIKMIICHGGLHAVTGWLCAVARDQVHPIAKEMLAGACRAGLNQKLHAVTGECVGWRPLGMCEKWSGLYWGCVNAMEKGAINHLLTNPLPEDVAAHELKVQNAESNLVARQVEFEAASAAGAGVGAASAARDAAAAALEVAKRPFKYVTNWCYARRGTVTLATMVRGSLEAEPRKGAIADDIEAMYQYCCRVNGFRVIRLRRPRLLASFRFFFGHCPVIWFGGATVPIERSASGSVVLGNASSTEVLRSCVGGQ